MMTKCNRPAEPKFFLRKGGDTGKESGTSTTGSVIEGKVDGKSSLSLKEGTLKKLLVFMGIFALILPLLFLGCEGDDGAQGIQGEQGEQGPPGPGVGAAAAQPESCSVCHNDQTARNGDSHQADYDQRFQDGVIVVSNMAYAYNGVDNTHTVTFEMTKNGDGFDCTQTSSTAPGEPSLGIFFAEYSAATRSFDPPAPLTERLNLESNPLVYDLATNLCTSTVNAGAEGDLSGLNGIIMVYGRDDTFGSLPRPSRVVLAVNPFAGLLVMGTVDYATGAAVEGCQKCHTIPYLKHGYIYARVDGDTTTDFYTCKACHADNGKGGHVEWQLLVDDPRLLLDLEAQAEASPDPDDEISDFFTPAQLATYSYRTRLMNDVHMSHAMEFAYPQSMSNCVVCHEGKLADVLTDANFVIETCKSCHPETDASYPDGKNYTDDHRAPALVGLLPIPGSITAHNPPFNTPCNGCHNSGPTGFAPVFSAIHTGYNTVIYGDTIGTKYSDAITVSIDNAVFDNNTKTLTVSFSAAGTLGAGDAAADAADIVPTLAIGLYGYNSKDFYIGPHERDANRDRFLEFDVDGVAVNPRFTVVTATPGSWEVIADLSMWAGYIDNNTIRRAEIAVMPDLDNAGGVQVALNAPSRTFDLGANAFDDGFYPAIVKVADGCNTCHEALATTFHNPDRGGNIVVCRLCHITKSPGSHLELQSRSIDSYTHAIHRFQVFDIGDIDFTDPVEELFFEHHVNSNFPRFGIEDCQSCHNPGVFNVPAQDKSMPGALSSADVVTTRNIGSVPSFVTGPATRACGACHRAEAIIADDGAGDASMLAAINSHMRTFGYLIEVPEGADEEPLVLEVTDAIFSTL
jgi:OmcA/MtrC family decaheme c-type cytochrome